MSKAKWKQKAKKLKTKLKKLEKKHHKCLKSLEKARKQSLHDELTLLPNRRYFNLYFEQQWSSCKRGQQPLGLLLCDLDDFKFYNDHFGHQRGDECLSKVGNILSHVVRRKHDLVARFGGEEFAVILPNTNSPGVSQLAEKILESVRSLNLVTLKSEHHFSVTLSIGGIVVTPAKEESEGAMKQTIDLADSALYLAKKLGKNRSIIHGHSLLQTISNSQLISNN